MKTRVFRLKNYIATYDDGYEIKSDVAYMFLGDGSDGCKAAITVVHDPEDIPEYEGMVEDWSVHYIDSDDYFNVHKDFVEFMFKRQNPLTKMDDNCIIYADIESEGTINPPFKIPKDLQIGPKTLDFINEIREKGIDDKEYTPLEQ